MPAQLATIQTPLGTFTLAADADTGALLATAFDDAAGMARRHPALQLQQGGPAAAAWERQVRQYFDGQRREFDMEVDAHGSEFQRRVWQALRQIPYGTTSSYGALARQLGTSARAVGRANATNPTCLVVPCHRVIGSDGSLTGFAYGHEAKAWLLRHEGVDVPAATPLLTIAATG
jgi:methylated-DNA-[protein]-cysteine S-methyltransferase